jgi:NitT/TauT family transport system permease protein
MATTTTTATSQGLRLDSDRLKDVGITLIGVIVLLGGWKLAADHAGMPAYILPDPVVVWQALWSGFATSLDSRLGYYVPLWATMSNAAMGLAMGVFAGILLGSLMSEFRSVEKMLMPYVFALQSLPKVAIAPLVIIWCGFGDGSKIVMAAMLTFFPMLVNSFAGLRATQPERIDLMRSLSASRLETYFRVKLPSAATFIFAGLDMAVVYALLGTIVAEFLGAQNGMGVVIIKAQSVTDTAGVFAALIVLGTVGILLHFIVKSIEHRVVHWGQRV